MLHWFTCCTLYPQRINKQWNGREMSKAVCVFTVCILVCRLQRKPSLWLFFRFSLRGYHESLFLLTWRELVENITLFFFFFLQEGRLTTEGGNVFLVRFKEEWEGQNGVWKGEDWTRESVDFENQMVWSVKQRDENVAAASNSPSFALKRSRIVGWTMPKPEYKSEHNQATDIWN